ncbi:hypothetical protein G7Y89_g4555 [Cudoniella acicularis]|uniref:Cytochrome P450 n=1 Tax=Cudoniella acicularis TaxID=354080 RepID=A0A8H4RQP4_9HELO|nr:hypothetical protein G7Y89_g4555 [Cudoniella acicularis]
MIGKFTSWPWIIQCIKGNQMNIGPGLFKKYGDIVRVGPADVMFADKATIQKILIDEDFRKSRDYEAVREDPHITSLITETDKVKYKQKVCRSTSHPQEKCSLNMQDVMSAALFGGSFNLVESDDSKQKDLLNRYLRRVAIDAQFPLVKYLPGVPSASSMISEVIEKTVSKRRKEMEKGISKQDILQIFVDTNNADPVSFTDKHIRDEMILFMIAGSDTTSLTATFTLLLLLNNQDKLKELISEIHSTFLSVDDAITFTKTQDLPYLNAVINESMRIMPIITAGIVRLVPENTMLCGYEIPKDMAR